MTLWKKMSSMDGCHYVFEKFGPEPNALPLHFYAY